MKIHPLPINNIYPPDPTREPGKKLRRLPHIFSRVLELPLSLKSDADVSVEESHDYFKFVAETNSGGSLMRAYMVETHPNVTKIVVRTNGSSLSLGLSHELELDVWRFRLPESTRPDLVTVDCDGDGELIVTVPKIERFVSVCTVI